MEFRTEYGADVVVYRELARQMDHKYLNIDIREFHKNMQTPYEISQIAANNYVHTIMTHWMRWMNMTQTMLHEEVEGKVEFENIVYV